MIFLHQGLRVGLLWKDNRWNKEIRGNEIVSCPEFWHNKLTEQKTGNQQDSTSFQFEWRKVEDNVLCEWQSLPHQWSQLSYWHQKELTILYSCWFFIQRNDTRSGVSTSQKKKMKRKRNWKLGLDVRHVLSRLWLPRLVLSNSGSIGRQVRL